MRNRLKMTWIWSYMLTKRLYKKVSFILILLLIPITVFAYGEAAKEDSGILTVALTAEDMNDPIARETMDALVNSSPLIRYVIFESPKEAEEQVRMFGADAAWIFPDDMGQRIHTFITEPRGREPIVQVITREKNIAVMLSGEKLSGILFTRCARAYYLHYLRSDAEVLDSLSDEELLSFYDDALIGDQLFSFTNISGNAAASQAVSYLLTPMRGLLGIILILCGLATAMYYIKDNDNGIFAFMPSRYKPFAEIGYQSVSLINMGLVSLISLSFLGVAVSREWLIVLAYAACSVSFCVLVRLICGNHRNLGTAMVVLTVLMLAICPIFYDFSALRTLQLLLPPTYFVNAAYNTTYFWYMILYTAICLGLSSGIRRIIKRY